MEIYKDLTNPDNQQFEQLLNSQLSKINIEEGKIIEGKVNKITEKYVFLHVDGLKSEPVLDINELKTMGLSEKIKVGEKIPVLLEKPISSNIQKAKKIISDFKGQFEKIDQPSRKILESLVNGLIKSHDTNFKGVGQPLRIVLTGSKFGPGIYDIILSLGKKEVQKRLDVKIV